jgi:hypothetical protein
MEDYGRIERGRIYQGQECNSRGATFFKAIAKLRRTTDMGARVLCRYVGRDTETIRRYIAEQEKEDRRIDQLCWSQPWACGRPGTKQAKISEGYLGTLIKVVVVSVHLL